jgi:chromosome partitioning protein
MYIERALAIAENHAGLFEYADPADAFVVTDDFVSSGRISGAKSILISELRIGSFWTVEGKRLQVNASATRYQRKLAYLVSVFQPTRPTACELPSVLSHGGVPGTEYRRATYLL